MKNVKSKVFMRLLAAILAVGMVLGAVPATATSVSAADIEVEVTLPEDGSDETWEDADQTLKFNEFSGEGSEEIIKGSVPFNNGAGITYDFSVTEEAQPAGGTIIYSLAILEDETDGTDDVARIDENGLLTVYYPGEITVSAKLSSANTNDRECEISYTLTVEGMPSTQGEYISFENSAVTYVLGTSDIVSNQAAVKNNKNIKGDISYAFTDEQGKNAEVPGLKINTTTGEVSVSDYEVLAAALHEKNGVLDVIVKAIKDAKGWYGTDYASYMLTLKFAETPDITYVITEGTEGEIDGVKTGWYTSPVVVAPADTTIYDIAKDKPTTFAPTQTFDNQGNAERYVYMKNKIDGGITDRIRVDIAIDTVKPATNAMRIEYSESISTVLNELTLDFYNPVVTVTFTAEDVTSGISHFDWIYTKEAGASTVNAEKESGTLDVTVDGATAAATLALTANEAKQYRGNLSFTATDKAGNESDKVTDKKNTIVVDTIRPTYIVTYTDPKVNKEDKQYYFDGDVTFTFHVNEANFFAEDVIFTAVKDGTPFELPADWVTWTDTNDDEHVGTGTLSGDGDYVITMNDTDKSTNKMVEYQSPIITIDTIYPELDFTTVPDPSAENFEQKTTFAVTEHNFRPEDITVTGVITDVTGKVVEGMSADEITELLRNATWVQDITDENRYTCELKLGTEYVSGSYDLIINYTDIVGHAAQTLEPETFIIDDEKPSEVTITYSKPLKEVILEALTFGFYNPDITVTFRAKDYVSGVKDFLWDYSRQNNVSSINRPTDTAASAVTAAQDKDDKTLYTASITLPEKEAEQLRGYFAVRATDKYGNVSEKVTDDGKIIVVDTVGTTMTVEYNAAARIYEKTSYYNGNIDVKFIVNEANFFAEDVNITVTRDGKPYDVVTDWTDRNADEHIGTFTLTEDGDYVINVEYTDYSGNRMESYTSDTLTIDTVRPDIEVSYTNHSSINTVTEIDNKERKYFNETQTAVVKITEHNFKADEVQFYITALDVAGNKLDETVLHSKSGWSVDSTGEVHTITITYPGDANYIFGIEYTDLATNAAENYEEDYFTVDKTAPMNLTVDYSTSVLDTVLENLTYGFYNAKVKVTVTAEDNISGVYDFVYDYRAAAGVSAVNNSLTEQKIETAQRKYSDSGRKATATFEIPRSVLDANSQFNGTIAFTAADRANNKTEFQDMKRIVVDNIAPNASVTYNDPVKTENGIRYYDREINTVVTFREANFYAEDVVVMVSKDGAAPYVVTPDWTHKGVDEHIGRFSLTEDGDYVITIEYADKSGNAMETYTSELLIVDTEIVNPVITINGNQENGRAYKDAVIPAVSFEDKNFEAYEITLTRTRCGNKNVDVTDKFVGDHITLNANGGAGTFDEFEKIVENDGIYILAVTMRDKSGHESSSMVTFTVNRFGSVYEYRDYLVTLIQDGGAYVTSITDDLVITEYNADRLVQGSLNIEITCDGKPFDEVKYEVSPVINEWVPVGESGWFQYDYVIRKDNFTTDGVYKISVSSKDATGNAPENTNFEDKNILFRVDSTAPEITSIVGLEESIINAQRVTVKYAVYDTIGLKSIRVFIDDKQAGETITDFTADFNNYFGSFVLEESNEVQRVRIEAEDLAGNITDTAAKEFESAYVFHPAVTVSTNVFVRWYANKPLFRSVIGGVTVLVGGIWLVIVILLRKAEKDT